MIGSDNQFQQTNIRSHPFAYIYLFSIAFGSFNVGFSFVNLSIVEKDIQKYNNLEDAAMPFYLTIVSCFLPLGAIFGTWLSKQLLRIGEHYALKNMDYLTLIAFLIMSNTLDFWSLIITHFLLGIVCGVSILVIPAYIKSLSPPDTIKITSSLHIIGITIGIMFGVYMGSIYKHLGILNWEGWQVYMFMPILYSSVRAIVFQAFFFNSLQRHIAAAQKQQLKEYMKLFYNKVDSIIFDQILKINSQAITQTKQQSLKSQGSSLGLDKQILIIIVVIIGLSHSLGLGLAIFYPRQLFMAILNFDQNKTSTSLGRMAIFLMVSIISSKYILKHYEKRQIIIYGGLVASICLILVAICSYVLPNWQKLLIGLIAIHIMIYSCSVGPISLVYLNQILANRQTKAIVFWGLCLVSCLFQLSIGTKRISSLFLCLGLISFGCLYYIYLFMMKTPNKEVETKSFCETIQKFEDIEQQSHILQN